MNKKLTFSLLFVFKVILGTELLNLIPEIEEVKIFRDINVQIQDIIDKMFTSLKLDNHFVEKNETRLLLTTVESLKKISENKYYIYNDVTNASRLDLIFNQYKNNSLFKLDKPLHEILMEDFNVQNGSVRKNNDIHLDIDSIEIPDDSDEAFAFLRNYLNNAYHVELEDIAKPSRRIKEMYEKHKQFRYARRRNLKIWKPSNSTELLKSDGRRVFKGTQVKIKKYPFVASIHVKNKFVCTGAVISRNMIITAACCLQEAFYNNKFLKDNPRSVFVRVGSDYPDHSGEWIEAVNIFIHPSYQSTTLVNNIAILQIKKHLHLKKKNRKIRRIEYQKMKGGLPDSVHEVVLLGWGEKKEKSQLSYSHLKIYEHDDCEEMYSKYVTEKNFCAGFSGKGAGACQHDVGGPAIVSNVLVGVVSFGPPVCGSPHAPTVFTNIGHHVTWIENIVQGKPDRITEQKPDIINQQPDGIIQQKPVRMIHKPQTTPSFEHRPLIGDFRQFSASPFTESFKAVSKAQYPNMHLLSNALRDMINPNEHGNQNSFNLRHILNMRNITTASVAMKSSRQPRNNPGIMTLFDINDFTQPHGNSDTTTTRSVNQGPNPLQLKPSNFFTRNANYTFTTNTNPEFPYPTRHILRYVTETTVTNGKSKEESASESDNYESCEEHGMEIDMPSTKPPATPKMSFMAPMSHHTLPSSYNAFLTFDSQSANNDPLPFIAPYNAPNLFNPFQSYSALRPFNAPQPFKIPLSPFSFQRQVALAGPNMKDSFEFMNYFAKNNFAPIRPLPLFNFEKQAEEFLMNNFVKDQLNSMDRESFFQRSSSPIIEPEISSEAEQFLGKNFFKNHNTEKAHGSKDDFVILLLKHTTPRNKGHKYQVTDTSKFKNEKNIKGIHPASFRTTRQPKAKFIDEFTGGNRPRFQTTRHAFSYKTVPYNSEDNSVVNNVQNIKEIEGLSDDDDISKRKQPVQDVNKAPISNEKQNQWSTTDREQTRMEQGITRFSPKKLRDMFIRAKYKKTERSTRKSWVLFKNIPSQSKSPKHMLKMNVKGNTHKTITSTDNSNREDDFLKTTIRFTLLDDTNSRYPSDQKLKYHNFFNFKSSSTQGQENYNVFTSNLTEIKGNISSAEESYYYFSSPEDMMYYGNYGSGYYGNKTQNIESNVGRRTFVDYIDLT